MFNSKENEKNKIFSNRKFYFIIIYVASQNGDDSFCLLLIDLS